MINIKRSVDGYVKLIDAKRQPRLRYAWLPTRMDNGDILWLGYYMQKGIYNRGEMVYIKTSLV